MDKKGQNGNLVKGIFIPIELNALETKDSAVYLPVKVVARDDQDQYGQNGFIVKNSKSSKKWSEMSEDEKKAHQASNPILGNIKDFSTSGIDSSGAAGAPIGEDDGLPF
ncbi:hypothetical protein D9M68_624840 [compost metagenome]